MTDPAALRRTYLEGRLDDSDVAGTWLAQLRTWFDAAVADPAVIEANAVQLATVDPDGAPDVRTVLAKGIDERGITFFTNYDSAKGRALAGEPRAAILFAWLAQERQVRLTGTVAVLDRDATQAYFDSRPRDSQIGAWASPQSQVVASRAELEAREQAVRDRFGDDPIPAPPHWGGYLLTPRSVEFWQGRSGRMHDRIRFRLDAGRWVTERLAP